MLSELSRREPDSGVSEWFAQRPATTLYISVLTLGELRKGVERLVDEPRRTRLFDWLEVEVPAFFSGRVLDIDAAVADCWGRLLAKAGRPLPAVDSLLAATAIHHELSLVTRNSRDFELPGLTVINPWISLR